MCIYSGFTLLLLMHALDGLITDNLFNNYYSTRNPFLFLRDLSGVLVMLGVTVALYRRFIMKGRRVITRAMDHYVTVIIAVIMISGFLLQGINVTSYSMYEEMVEEYGRLDDEEEGQSLEAYWIQEFGVVSPALKGPFHASTLDQGKALHEMSCLECHSAPQWGFASYAVAKTLKPFAVSLDNANLSKCLWYVHFLACFIGLAYLPFSKMVHVFVSPLSLLVNAVVDKNTSHPANIATKQVMELDACTHCGICNVRCAVSVAFEEISNVNILPSEKIGTIKTLASGRELSEQDLMTLQEGIYVCTNCNRCTVACPVGINLQDLWFNVREALLQNGHPEVSVLSNLSFYRGVKRDEMLESEYREPVARAREAIASMADQAILQDKSIPLTPSRNGHRKAMEESIQANTFSHCFTCKTCTTACPVVFNFEHPQEALGLLPHQIIRSTAMGFTDLAFSANMLWDCLACYQCQEYCPQDVHVTDIFYKLKNLAVEKMRENAWQSMGDE
jgi:heterodisulfide reductase subunit C/nitrate reductase gamma subunit